MRLLLCKRNRNGLILAVLAAGAFGVPAASAQSTVAPVKKPVHKSSSGSGTSSSANSTTTRKSTSSKSSSRKTGKKVKGQAVPTPERISEIQEALARKGALSGTASGKWDDSTVEAMKKFQASNGLTPSGKLDALTLQKLGLGSETAGLAAPTPPPNSTNRLRNQTSSPVEVSN